MPGMMPGMGMPGMPLGAKVRLPPFAEMNIVMIFPCWFLEEFITTGHILSFVSTVLTK